MKNPTPKTTRTLAGLSVLAILTIGLAPLASAADTRIADWVKGGVGGPTGDPGCHKTESGGSWNEDCAGVKGNCVGTWGSSGSYTTNPDGSKSYTTTTTHEDLYCA